MGVSWSPDGQRLASASGDFLIMEWDAETGRKRSTMHGHNDWVDAVVWSPDGTRLASAGIDSSVRLWDPRTGEETLVLRGHSGMFHDVSWHPDGAQLAAASSDGQIWIWDATRGFERDTTTRALPYIGRRVASGTAHGEELLSYAEVYVRSGRRRDALLAVKDDPYALCGVARMFEQEGDAPLAGEARTSARALLEKQLSAQPDDSGSASELADLLLMGGADRWAVLIPIEMKTETGTRLELQKDGTVFAHQHHPFQDDTYSLVSRSELKGITALRLEVLADSRLPHGGPGWGENGNFSLNELTLAAAPAEGPGEAKAIVLRNAWADFSSGRVTSGYWDVQGAVDGDGRTGWAVYPQFNQDHRAVFELAEPVGDGRASRLTVRLVHRSVDRNRNLGNLGRIRLSVSVDPAVVTRERRRARARKLTDPWEKLAAAYHINGDRPALDSLLQRHPAAAAGIGDRSSP
jgi:hypothetical protein